MKSVMVSLLSLFLVVPLVAQVQRGERRSLLDSDPGVVYLSEVVDPPIKLHVEKQAAVFSDKEGKLRLGFLKADQTVVLEGMTDRVYRVRGEGTRDGIVGWVAPWAFTHPDPEFVPKLKQLYERQMAVNEIIEKKEVAIGMTMSEVERSRGKPTKTSIRRTAEGEAGTWEFIDYQETKHYITNIHPGSGQAYRQFSHVTREESGKTIIEFKDDTVTAIEESENRGPGNVRIIVPPLVFRW